MGSKQKTKNKIVRYGGKNQLALFGGKPALRRQLGVYNSIGEGEKKAVIKFLDDVISGKKLLSGFLGRGGPRFFGGEEVQKLEREWKEKFKVRHAVSFNSATTALHAAIAAAGIGPGDEVITSPFTMSATASAVLMNNGVPVFADVDPETLCISAATIAPKISKRTKAILAVNLLGSPADYDPILALAKKHKLIVIEDSAQAPGALYRGKFAGTIGDIGIFSFNVHKTIQTGEGGMLVTNNDRFAYRAQLARNHAEAIMGDVWDKKPAERELMIGSNYRLSEIHAVIMHGQLKKLDRLNHARVALAGHLTKSLKQFSWLAPAVVLPKSTHVYYLYPIKFFSEKIGIRRDTFIKAMKAEGFDLTPGYNFPLHLLPIYKEKRMYEGSQFPFVSEEYPHEVSYGRGECPVTERMWDKELLTTSICQPPKTKTTIDLFIQAVKKIDIHRDELKAYEQKAT